MKTMNEQQFAHRIRLALNERARLDGVLAERLRVARERALAAQKPERAPALAWADNVLGRMGGLGGLSLQLLLPAVLVALGLAAIYAWQKDQLQAEVEEIDAMLLTDDLPIDAYLDRGFEAWLKKRSAR